MDLVTWTALQRAELWRGGTVRQVGGLEKGSAAAVLRSRQQVVIVVLNLVSSGR